jgi:hypothetical protein
MATKRAQAKKATAPRKKAGPKTMSVAHKAALEAGRQESRVVRQYLDVIDARQPRRGRQRTAESITKRLTAIEAELDGARSLNRLHLLQEKQDLQADLSRVGGGEDVAELEAGFVEVAKSYSDRKGIVYSTWRDVGVSADVLKRAGVGR